MPGVETEDLRAYLPIVHQVVGGVIRRMPPNVLRDDLVAAGSLGLLHALRKISDRGPAFEAYARVRVRGAVIDELRSADWLSRRARARFARANETIRFEGLMDRIDESLQPDQEADDRRRRAVVERAVQRLPKREARIIVGHYFDGLGLVAIASELGVSQPRVSQLHMRALGHLRASLAGEGRAA